jgi:hypothetical protein
MSSKQLLSNDSGLTIIEALIALAIFSIGLMAMGALQARSLMDTGDVARKTEAWTIADEQATLLKEMPFMNTATWTTPPALVAGNHQVTNGRYDVHWTVFDGPAFGAGAVNALFLPGVPAGNYTVDKRIIVSVTPVGGNPPNDTIAEVQFVKTWWATGCP